MNTKKNEGFEICVYVNVCMCMCINSYKWLMRYVEVTFNQDRHAKTQSSFHYLWHQHPSSKTLTGNSSYTWSKNPNSSATRGNLDDSVAQRKQDGGDEKIAHKKIWWWIMMVILVVMLTVMNVCQKCHISTAWCFSPQEVLLQGWHLGRENHTFTHRRLYTGELLHTDAFTHRTLVTQSSYYTQKALHRGALHTDAFTHRKL